jgi:hypothetical protein
MRRHRRSATDSTKYHALEALGPATPTTTPPDTAPHKPPTTPTTPTLPAVETWWQKTLFAASLIAVGALLAGFEFQAGRNADFPWQVALAVPLAFDAYALWTWLDADRKVWDELAAVGILAASVVLSTVPARNWLALGIGLLAILVQWRNASRRRAATGTRHSLAAALAGLDRVRAEAEDSAAEWRRQLAAEEDLYLADVAALQEQVAALEADLAAARAAASAAPPPPTGGTGGGPARVPAWGRTKETQTEWLRRELAAGRNYTGETVAELMGLGSAKTGRDRLAEARRLRPVTNRNQREA